MRQGQVVGLGSALALSAARLGVEHKFALADSVIYATAHRVDALLWTQDADCDGLPGVRFVAKQRVQSS